MIVSLAIFPNEGLVEPVTVENSCSQLFESRPGLHCTCKTPPRRRPEFLTRRDEGFCITRMPAPVGAALSLSDAALRGQELGSQAFLASQTLVLMKLRSSARPSAHSFWSLICALQDAAARPEMWH